ncbi:lipocalin family protein, partial [Okeania sp. SIO2G5]|uniref:lipocalin family protein n=1 Tax=Okeania sp. SIO2G5 TaxID=2607796 RepID=UPI0013BF65EE
GKYISADGTPQTLTPADWQIDVLDTWHSANSQADYPAQWHIEVPKLDLILDGASLMADQELHFARTYWEGAVGFDGTVGDRAVSAKGYVEMTGYADRLDTVL